MLRILFWAILIGSCQVIISTNGASSREWTEAELTEGPSIPALELPIFKKKLRREHAARVAALADAKTLVELSRLVGSVPDRCESTGDTSRVCSWLIGKKMPGYDLLAALVETTQWVSMVCDLPFDNSERVSGSCWLSAAD